jgi:hypothetical protein
MLDTIGANMGFEQLQAMRAASPTGGALGNVTERELELLQAVQGSLQQSQSREQFQSNLLRRKERLLLTVSRSGAGRGVAGREARGCPCRAGGLLADGSAGPRPS